MINYIYFFLISFSMIGYGILANKILRINISDFGNLGILGITFISIISYSSSIFLNHGLIFNTIFLILGLIILTINFSKIKNLRKEIFVFFIIFLLLLLFISVGKNHDDFSYYHFPYSILISEYSHPIGLGQLNNGFRSPSSIFFINSMFYLPGANYYLFHFAAAHIFGFTILTLLNISFDKEIFKSTKFINFLSLISIIFTTIFFYRLAEHGTDRSGMILTMLAIIYLLLLINKNYYQDAKENEKFIKLFIIYIFFIITIKPFYLINIIFLTVLLFFDNLRKIFFKLFFTRTFYYCIVLFFFTTIYTFLNSGCLVFPLAATCFENLDWSLDVDHIKDVSIWFELWSKAGANPDFVVDDRIKYIKNFNWLPNWIEIYFFNKVIDFICGVLFLTLIIYLSFFKKEKSIKTNYQNFFPVYLCLIILFFEWFLNHPTLRYGGYHVIALIFFIPICLYLGNKNFDFKIFFKRGLILLIITSGIFMYRNIDRLEEEFIKYDYNLLKSVNYQFIGGNKDYHFRHNIQMKKNLEKFEKKFFLGKEILIINLN
jgi:hypothetical protein